MKHLLLSVLGCLAIAPLWAQGPSAAPGNDMPEVEKSAFANASAITPCRPSTAATRGGR